MQLLKIWIVPKITKLFVKMTDFQRMMISTWYTKLAYENKNIDIY